MHTKEPWAIEAGTNLVWGPAPSDDTRTWGNAVCEAKVTGGHYGRGIKREEAAANARRIVDCVNAMQGIPDPAAYVAAMGACVEAGDSAIGPWLSAALDDPNVSGVMKRDIEAFFVALAAARAAMPAEHQP